MILLHWDEGGDVATADWASLLGLHQLLSTVLADAEVAAWHNERVFAFRQADQALSVGVIIFDGLLTFFSIVFGRHAIDGLEFEGKAVDECDLFDDVDTVDILISVLLERAIGHHGVLSLTVGVVHRNDHGVVILDGLRELKCGKVVDVELDLTRLNLLVTTGMHSHVEDVVVAVGRIEHFRSIVWVLFLGHAHIDTDVGIAQCIIFERDVQFLIITHSLRAKENKKYTSSAAIC